MRLLNAKMKSAKSMKIIQARQRKFNKQLDIAKSIANWAPNFYPK